MTTFFDTSALVRLSIDEQHHELVRAIEGTILTAHVTGVELCSALWRKVREGAIDDAEATALLDAFEAEVDDPDSRFVRLPISPEVLTHAGALVRRHALRAYDAVQLGTAMLAREDRVPVTHFATFDRGLRAAALAEGFTPAPQLPDD